MREDNRKVGERKTWGKRREIARRMPIQLFSSNLHVIMLDIYITNIIRHCLKKEINEALNVHTRSIEYLKDNFQTGFKKK